MLTVIHDEQERFGPESVGQRFDHVTAGLLGHAQSGRDRLRDQRRVRDRRELREPHSVWIAFHHVGGYLEREPGLARPARTGKRDEASLTEQPFDLGDLPLAADETGQLDGQVVRMGIQ
jgi:hypothetical protein